MKLSDADVDRLTPCFQRYARRPHYGTTSDDFLSEMWYQLLCHCQRDPDHAAWLLQQQPSFIAFWAASRSQAFVNRERRRAHESLPETLQASATPAPELTTLVGQVTQDLFGESPPEAIAVVCGLTRQEMRRARLNMTQVERYQTLLVYLRTHHHELSSDPATRRHQLAAWLRQSQRQTALQRQLPPAS